MGWPLRRGWRRYSPALLLPALLWVGGPDEIERAKQEATAQLVEILDLWHREEYGAIYDRGTATTKRLFTREEFISRMLGLGCRTTCCHTTFELHSADYRSPRLVVVRGKVGLEFTGRITPRFRCAPVVRSYPMTREGEGWRLDLTLILPFF
ncbi:MAG: hypothetical protein ACE5I9_02040 [Candidatus Methylomirabilales bacterium]